MLWLYKIALAPVLLVQARRVRRDVLRLAEPPGPRDGVVGTAVGMNDGRDISVLFVGDSSAAGVGVSHQSEALALPTATRLAALLNTRVRWQLIAKAGINTGEAIELVAHNQLARADVVVTSLGVNDVTSQLSSRQFYANYKALLKELLARSGAKLAVITGLPPMRILPAAPQPLRWYLGKYAQRLDQTLSSWCAPNESMAFLSLDWAAKPDEMAIDRYHPGKGQYQRWSELVCRHAMTLLAR